MCVFSALGFFFRFISLILVIKSKYLFQNYSFKLSEVVSYILVMFFLIRCQKKN